MLSGSEWLIEALSKDLKGLFWSVRGKIGHNKEYEEWRFSYNWFCCWSEELLQWRKQILFVKFSDQETHNTFSFFLEDPLGLITAYSFLIGRSDYCDHLLGLAAKLSPGHSELRGWGCLDVSFCEAVSFETFVVFVCCCCMLFWGSIVIVKLCTEHTYDFSTQVSSLGAARGSVEVGPVELVFLFLFLFFHFYFLLVLNMGSWRKCSPNKCRQSLLCSKRIVKNLPFLFFEVCAVGFFYDLVFL